MKIIKKAVALVLALGVILITSLTAFADSVTDVDSPDDRFDLFGAVNRFSNIYIDTSTDAGNERWIYSTDSRYGNFEVGTTHNQDMVITNIRDAVATVHNIETFITRYPADTSRDHNRLVFGFMRPWCANYLNRATVVTIEYPICYYSTSAGRSTFFDYVLAGSDGTITSNMSAVLCTKNFTTGEVVKKSVSDYANTSGILNFEIWSSLDINSRYDNFNGVYWLENVTVRINAPSGLNYLQVGGSALHTSLLDDFEYTLNQTRDAGGDIHDFNFGWLLDAVQAFLAFEILPGIKLYLILSSIAGFGLLMWFIKMFGGG